MKLKLVVFSIAIAIILLIVFYEAIMTAIAAFFFVIGIYLKMLVLALVTIGLGWLYFKAKRRKKIDK